MSSVGFWRRARRLAALPLVLVLTACAAPPPTHNADPIDRVLALIEQRLGYMDDVARNKWNSGAPIEDLPRELEIIESLGRQAPEYGLDPVFARDFFRRQIEASKIIQRTRFAEWRAQDHPPFTHVRDLRNTIRPALDALTPELMKSMAAAMPMLCHAGAAALISARANKVIVAGGPNRAALDEALAPLKCESSGR